ncbi:MAG: DUF971 domain-containing protein [Ignavibacteriaceae bacterium]|nr:DUF971 domain-containing protein [Ignavibacteriaceae bacterium]
MIPKTIKIKDKSSLNITWEDGLVSTITLKYLRDECPCATCKGETVLLRTYRPPAKKMITPEMYLIKNIETVGEYAIQITWKDGHNTGIYTYEYLLELDRGQKTEEKQDYDTLL